MTMTRRTALAAVFALAAGAHGLASAQAYPSRPITIIVPYSAGGGMDVVARAVGKRLGEELGQPVVVENRTGANGLIGVTAVARSKPDGYTLLMANTTPNSIMPLISKEVTYDPLKDFETLAIVSYTPMLIVEVTCLPSNTSGLPAIESRIRSATSMAPSGGVSGSSTTNSSPP